MMDDLHSVYTISWDGDPEMGGGHHTVSAGELTSYSEAATLLEMYEERDAGRNPDSRKQNLRIRTRKVTDWKDV